MAEMKLQNQECEGRSYLDGKSISLVEEEEQTQYAASLHNFFHADGRSQ